MGEKVTDEISLRIKFNVITIAEMAFPQSMPTMGTTTHEVTLEGSPHSSGYSQGH